MLASTNHISLSAVPLWNDCNDTQALALWILWIWEIAVGTIQEMIRTQSDPLSTQSYLGRKRNEELTSLLLQCDQSFIPVKAVCQIPSLATQLGTVTYWLIFGKKHWLLYFHSFLWWWKYYHFWFTNELLRICQVLHEGITISQIKIIF